MATKEKYGFLKIRSVDNGWEVYPASSYTGSNDHFTSACYVFETWESLSVWLREHTEDNTAAK